MRFVCLALALLLAGCSSAPSSYYYAQKQLAHRDLTFHHTLRVNEYLNAFPQDWLEVPAGQDLVLRIDPMVGELPPVGELMLYQVAVKTRSLTQEEAGKPVALSLVVDVSGSMAGENIQALREALQAAIMELKEGDVVSLVTFNERAHLDVSALRIGPETRAALGRMVATLSAGGGTNIEAGLLLGYRELAGFPKEMTSRLLLLTDGHSTVGPVEPEQIAARAGVARVEGARISTIGLGHGVDQRLLRALAEAGGGHYYFADNSKTLTGILREGLATTVVPVASDVHVDLQLGEGLKLEKLYGAEPRPLEDGRVRASLGELNAHDWRILILEARRVAETGQSVAATASFHSPESGETTLVPGTAPPAKALNPKVLRNAVIYANAQALVETGHLVEAGEHDKALHLLDLQISNNHVLRHYDSSEQVANELVTLRKARELVAEIRNEPRNPNRRAATRTPAEIEPVDPSRQALRELIVTSLEIATGAPPGTWVTITRLLGLGTQPQGL